jgi:hypothetical protein
MNKWSWRMGGTNPMKMELACSHDCRSWTKSSE